MSAPDYRYCTGCRTWLSVKKLWQFWLCDECALKLKDAIVVDQIIEDQKIAKNGQSSEK